MAIIQAGSANTVGQVVPGFRVIIQKPGVQLAGAPTDTVGVVGAASWGILNTPQVFSGTSDGQSLWGLQLPRTYDMMTAVAASALQGCQSYIGVRVSDGTDTAAMGSVIVSSASQFMIVSKCTGAAGNSTTFTFSQNTDATWRIVVANTVLGIAETYDKIANSGAVGLYANFIAAVNPASQLVVLVAGAGTFVPTALPYTATLAGGTDGATSLTDALMVGTDGLTRTGMYALRKQPVSILCLTDVTSWGLGSTINALAISEGWYALLSGPQGQGVQAAASVGVANVAGYGVKFLHGDWLYFADQVNGSIRLVSPASFAAGLYATLAPNQSGLNKPLAGMLGSQRSGLAVTGQSATFSDAEKAVLILAGVDLIANPSPGGGYWAIQRGLNASGVAAINGDNYTRMTNFLATTLSGPQGMGGYIGQPITTTLFGNVRASLLGLLSNMVQQGLLDPTFGAPYAVVCDTTNNPLTRTSLGYLQADVQVQYESITLFLNVTLAAGQTINVTTTSSGG